MNSSHSVKAQKAAQKRIRVMQASIKRDANYSAAIFGMVPVWRWGGKFLNIHKP